MDITTTILTSLGVEQKRVTQMIRISIMAALEQRLRLNCV